MSAGNAFAVHICSMPMSATATHTHAYVSERPAAATAVLIVLQATWWGGGGGARRCCCVWLPTNDESDENKFALQHASCLSEWNQAGINALLSLPQRQQQQRLPQITNALHIDKAVWQPLCFTICNQLQIASCLLHFELRVACCFTYPLVHIYFHTSMVYTY